MAGRVDAKEKASPAPSWRGASAGSAGSHRIDFPDRRTGKLPLPSTSGGPSASPDVDASRLVMQNMIMNDDDIAWYEELFRKMHRRFLRPRHTVESHGKDHRTNTYGVFIPVPDQLLRRLEIVYPRLLDRSVDDSPPHITVLYVGELDESQAEELRKTVRAAIETLEPFAVRIEGTGHFDNPDQTVFYARVVSDALVNLHHVLKSSVESAGIPVNHRYGPDGVFKAHVTLSYGPPGKHEDDLAIVGAWLVDRVEVWSMGSPVSMKFNGAACLGCSVGLCGKHVTEAKKKKKDGANLLLEPDTAAKKKKPKKSEVNAVASGNVSGYTLPLGKSNQSKRQQRKRAAISARSFGGGKFV